MAASTTLQILEQDQRLSDSILWQILRNFYARQGLNAWQDSTVPHYVTCNPTIADAYARIVLGYLQDSQRAYPNTTQPFPILELGGGSGRFAFLFLQRLTARMQQGLDTPIPFIYILSDFSPSTVAAWQQHPALRPFVKQGILDFAQFDPVHHTELRLIERDEALTADDIQTSGVVLANYFFDSLPTDLFRVKDHNLFELRVTLSSAQKEIDLTDPALVERIQFSYDSHPVAGGYYVDTTFDKILQGYAHWPDTEALNFPIGALHCYENLVHLFQNDLLLLSADYGFVDQAIPSFNAAVTPHNGAFSQPVNYHALATYTHQQAGKVLQPIHPPTSLCMVAFLTGSISHRCRETERAFIDSSEFAPDDFSWLIHGLQAYHDGLTLPELIALLRFSKGDVHILAQCLPVLRSLVKEASEAHKQALRQEFNKAWLLYYHLEDTFNLPFEIGIILHQMGFYSDALFYYQHAQSLYGDDMELLYNMAYCAYQQGDFAQAQQLLAQGQQWLGSLPALIQQHAEQRFQKLRAAIDQPCQK